MPASPVFVSTAVGRLEETVIATATSSPLRAVILPPRTLNRGISIDRPVHELCNGAEQRAAEVRQRVLHLRRLGGIHTSRHVALALEVAQILGEHALRDVADQPLDLVEAPRLVLEHREDQEAPLVSDLVEDAPERTVLRVFVVAGGYSQH